MKIFDAATLFRTIRRVISNFPNPCYCIRKAIKNVEFYSVFLGLKPYYIKYKSQKSQKGKQIHLEFLEIISSNLKNSFKYFQNVELNSEWLNKIKIIDISVRNLIRIYRSNHNLKLYAHGSDGVLEHHPNLKLDFFKIIDSLEKSYWLGWSFAEGYITIKKLKSGKKYYQFGVGCEQNDFILIERFAEAIGLDIVKKSPRKEEYRTLKGEIRVFRRITIINNEFSGHLISHGFIVGKQKSKNIRLPKLKNRKLLLAFLLGYYDGDGTMGRSRITSSSKKLLDDILNSPFLNVKVLESKTIQFNPITKKYIVNGSKISLGTNLMREMINNFKTSLPRKRKHWEN